MSTLENPKIDMLSHGQRHHKQQPQLQKKFILIPLCLIWKRMRMRSSSPRPKRNAQRAHYLVLSQCTKIPKIKPNRITGWSQASTAFDVPDIVKLIKSNIFKFEYVKYLPILIHQSKTNFNAPHPRKHDRFRLFGGNLSTQRTWYMHSRGQNPRSGYFLYSHRGETYRSEV